MLAWVDSADVITKEFLKKRQKCKDFVSDTLKNVYNEWNDKGNYRTNFLLSFLLGRLLDSVRKKQNHSGIISRSRKREMINLIIKMQNNSRGCNSWSVYKTVNEFPKIVMIF